jgi:tRNA(fMet)-specific endonuclease VapC
MPLYVLDTDHLTLVQRAEPKVSHRYFTVPKSDLAASVISYEEQMRGRLTRISQAKTPESKCAAYARLCQTQQFYCGLHLLEVDAEAERIFEILRQTHRRSGRMDLQIAATVLATDAILVTRNTQDFIAIANLRLENWA